MAKDTSKSGGASASDTSSRAADQDRASKDLTRVHVWQIQAVRDVMFVAVIVLIIWLGYLLSAVTVPLLVGLLLAYLFEPLVARISAHPKIRRPVAVVMILGVGTIVLAAVAAIAIPIIVGQTDRLAGDIREGRLAQQFARVDSYIPEAWRDDYRSFVGVLPGGDRAIDTLVDTEAPTEDIVEPVEADEVPATQSADGEATADDPVEPTVSVDETAEIVVPTTAIDPADMTAEEFRAFVDGAVAEKIAERESEIAALSKDDDGGGGSVFAFARGGAEAVWRFVGAAIHIGFLAVLIPYFFFFFSMWFPSISEFVRSCIPEKRKDRTLELLGKMDVAVAGFVRGRIVISIVMGILLAIGWFFVGVPYSLIIGIITGIFCAVPYLGLVGLPAAILLLILHQGTLPDAEQTGLFMCLLLPTIVFVVVQLIEGYVLTPAIAGKATNLDPVSILVAVLAGATLLGVYGMLLAIPIAACGKILLLEIVRPKVRDWVEGRAVDPLPIDRE